MNDLLITLHKDKLSVYMYSQGPKVFPQNKFPIDSNAFSSLHEALYCVVSMFDNNYFVIVVKLNDSCTHCTIYIKI